MMTRNPGTPERGNEDPILIVTTGGTIDKVYFDRESAFQVGEPQVAEVLAEANVAFRFRVTALLRKDSLDLTDADRQLILDTVAAAPERRVVVTHGTDTMVQTALALRSAAGKVVVLTGAMQPARFRHTDAVFNIACAVTAVQLLPEGVYLAMNGRVLDPQHAWKNRAANRFEQR